MSKTKKTIRFYSAEEMKVLNPIIKSNQAVNKELLADFCKKYNRPLLSVQNLIYTKRRRLNMSKGKKLRKSSAKLRSNADVINLTKGEFNIPIKSWNITQNESGFYFNVKF